MKRTDKVLSISHDDLDGATCSIVLKNVFENIDLINCKFGELESYLKVINFDSFDWVIITDTYPEKHMNQLDNPKLILLDHHKSNPHHNPKNKIVVKTDYCAAKLTKLFFEKKFEISLSHLDKLIDYVNDYDLWIHQYPESKRMNLIYWKYYSEKFIKRFLNGFDEFTKYEMNYITKQEEERQKAIDELQISQFEGTKIAFFLGEPYINEICEYLLYEKDFVVVFAYNMKTKKVSVRGKYEEIDLGKILTKFEWGGGHPNAAGMIECDTEEMKKRIEKVVEYLKKNCEEVIL